MTTQLNEFKIDRNTPFDQIPDEWVKDIEVPEIYMKDNKVPKIIHQKIIYVNRVMGMDTTHPVKVVQAKEEDFHYCGKANLTPEQREMVNRMYVKAFMGMK